MSQEDKLLELVSEAADIFDWEDFTEGTDVDVLESEEMPHVYSDIVRDGAVFRMFILDHTSDLDNDIPDLFDIYREFESEFEDIDQATLVWRSADEDDFWYMRRTEEGDIGLFNSDFSLDDDDEEEEEEEEKEGNGKKI